MELSSTRYRKYKYNIGYYYDQLPQVKRDLFRNAGKSLGISNRWLQRMRFLKITEKEHIGIELLMKLAILFGVSVNDLCNFDYDITWGDIARDLGEADPETSGEELVKKHNLSMA